MKYEKVLTKKFLIKEYVKGKKGSIRIAKLLNCSHATVSNYLKKYSIEIRTYQESSIGKNNSMFDVHRFGKDNPNFKEGKYTKENCFCIICGKKTCRKGQCLSCANKLRKKCYYCIECGKEIDRKRTKQCKECQLSNMPSGESHPNYIDGKGNSPYPLEFNDKLKAVIRKRDYYTCQNCEMTEEEHIIVLGRNLPVHHIDYNKQNCKEINLITLCNLCNIRANYNRGYWKKYFLEKLAKKL